MVLRQRTKAFTLVDYERIRRRMHDRRKGSKIVVISRADWAGLLIDVARNGGVGSAMTDDEVYDAYAMIGSERGEMRRVPDGLAAKMLQVWWYQQQR